MIRSSSLALLAFAGLAAAPAAAAGGFYRAEPATAPSTERLIVRDLVWKCESGACVAGRSTSRPVVDCSALARRVGALRSFTVQGRALSAEDLEKCNASAR